MMPSFRLARMRWLALAGCLLIPPGIAAGQEPAVPPAAAAAGEAEAPGDEAMAAAGTDAEPTDRPFREQSIYIPYEKLREVFEREGRGVFLPYDEFQKLWQAARAAEVRPREVGPPVDALITEMESRAEVSADVVRVSATLTIEVLSKGWHEVPLRLADAAITSASIGDEAARIVAGADGRHRLLLHKKDNQPEQFTLRLEYVKAYEKSPGRNSVSFEAPQAPVSRWRVHIPEPGVKVDIRPLIAATEAPEKTEDATEPETEGTVLLAFVGAAPAVSIDWTPRAEGATGLQALITASATHQIRIDEGVMRTQTMLDYEISRAAIDTLKIEVPKDQRVVNVYDANVRRWSVEQADEAQTVTVELFEPAQGRQRLSVELEQFAPEGEAAAASGKEEWSAPMVRAMDAGRQQGTLLIGVGEGLRVEALDRSGLLQLDAGQPAGNQPESPADEWSLSYRYASLPFKLVLGIEKVEPRITVDTLVIADIDPERLTLAVQAIYTIEKAGVFSLRFAIPDGYSFRNPRGTDAHGATPIQLESHRTTEDGRAYVELNLSRRAIGKTGLAFQLYRRLDEPNLTNPTGHPAEITLQPPDFKNDEVERVTGRLMVFAPESLRVNPDQAEGLRSIPIEESHQEADELRRQHGRGKAEARMAYAFAEGEPRLSLKAERRKPHVTVRQLLTANIESGVVKYEANLFYDVLYSEVDTLRIDVPEDVARSMQNRSDGAREARIEPPPDDLPEGYVALRFRGEPPFKGARAVRFTWESKIESLQIGQSTEFSVPRIRPREADRSWGQLVLAKAETIDLRATTCGAEETAPDALPGLRPIDPRHDLMEGAARQLDGAARAFEFHDEWSLCVLATRYKLEEIKRTSVERAYIRAVVTRSDRLSTQALYRMRSAHQRLPVSLPSGVEFDTDPVRINGRPVALERGQKDEFFIPLTDQTPEKPFVLELKYSVPNGGSRVACPTFPADPAIQKTHMGTFIPPEWAFLGARGPWTDEIDWRWRDLQGFEPRPKAHDLHLVNWVTQGIAMSGNPAETFQTDGQFLLFSTFHPLDPPKGALLLVTVHDTVLDVIVVAVVVALGLFLLGASATSRWLAMGTLLMVLVLLGVFVPAVALQLLDSVLIAALAVVAIIWLIQYLGWTRPRDPRLIALKQARQRARLARIRAKHPQPATAGESSGPQAEEGGQSHG